MKTTITISVDTWNELKSLRDNPKQSYDDVIMRLVRESKQ